MIYAIYPRKSKRKDDSESMDMQVEKCMSYIKTHFPDAQIVVYGADYGVTGHSTKKRPDFLRMMNDARNKCINGVVIYKYDRIARNMYDFVNLFHDLEDAGCSLISVTQDIDTSTPSGRLMMYQLAAFAEHEWEMASQRYKDTFAYMDKAGLNHFNKATLPLGYMPDKINKKAVKDPSEAPIVEYAIQDYLIYGSIAHTVKAVNEHFNTTYTRQNITTVIKHDIMRGKYKDNLNFCEPYIDAETDAKIQVKLKEAPVRVPKWGTSEHCFIFSGLIKCPWCGKRLNGSHTTNKFNKTFFYYRCPMHTYRLCDYKSSVSQLKAEKFVLDNVEKMLNDYVVKVKVKEEAPKPKVNVSALKKELDRLTNAYVKGRVTEDVYDKEYNIIQGKIDKAMIENLSTKPKKDYSKIFPNNWKAIYSDLSREDKRAFWKNIIKEIKVDDKGKVFDIIFQ